MGINIGGGASGPVGTAAATFTIVEYDAGWPARPALPEGYAVMWINRTDDTLPPSGVDGYVAGLDIALCALPEA